ATYIISIFPYHPFIYQPTSLTVLLLSYAFHRAHISTLCPYTTLFRSSNGLERPARGGNSPVGERHYAVRCILSTAEHEEFRRNPGGPSPKAKYSLVTDSEPVP